MKLYRQSGYLLPNLSRGAPVSLSCTAPQTQLWFPHIPRLENLLMDHWCTEKTELANTGQKQRNQNGPSAPSSSRISSWNRMMTPQSHYDGQFGMNSSISATKCAIDPYGFASKLCIHTSNADLTSANTKKIYPSSSLKWWTVLCVCVPPVSASLLEKIFISGDGFQILIQPRNKNLDILPKSIHNANKQKTLDYPPAISMISSMTCWTYHWKVDDFPMNTSILGCLDDTIRALLATQLVIPCLFVEFQWFWWTLNFCSIWWTKATSVCWNPGIFLAKFRCAICSQCLFVETTHELPFFRFILVKSTLFIRSFFVALKLIDGMGDVRQLIWKLRTWENGWWIADVLNNMRIIMKNKFIYNRSYPILVIFHDMLIFKMIDYYIIGYIYIGI